MSRKNNRIKAEQFIPHSREMRESAAWNTLSDNGRRLLDRVEREHMAHGGAENGQLIVTYNDFEEAGLRRQSVSRAIEEAETLGFLKVTERGRPAISDFRRPSRYALTYVYGHKRSIPSTNDWRRFATLEEARGEVEAMLARRKARSGT